MIVLFDLLPLTEVFSETFVRFNLQISHFLNLLNICHMTLLFQLGTLLFLLVCLFVRFSLFIFFVLICFQIFFSCRFTHASRVGKVPLDGQNSERKTSIPGLNRPATICNGHIISVAVTTPEEKSVARIIRYLTIEAFSQRMR